MTGECFGPGDTGDGAKNERDNDCVVRVSEDGDEVGDQVDGQGEVDEQESELDPDGAGQGRVSREGGAAGPAAVAERRAR